VLFVLFAFVLYLVSNVACVSGLSIRDCPYGFLKRLYLLQLYILSTIYQYTLYVIGVCLTNYQT
jgi:hypothetical protein